MKKYIYILIMALLLTLNSQSIHAQQYTYAHDATKMNQFTMQEIGTGSFQGTSEWYYDLFHHSYKNSLLATSKQIYRTATYQGSYSQVEYADSIRKRLEARAKEEAFNMADREVDLAWVTEQSKIENALNKYNNNLSKLATCRTNSEEMEDWRMYPKMWNFAIDRTRKAYMANSERQKEFLTIYNEIVKRNSKLVSRIRYLKTFNGTQDVIEAQPVKHNKFTEVAIASYNRWREAAWTVKANNNNSQINDMIKALMMSEGLASEGIRRFVILPLDFFIETKLKEDKSVELSFYGKDVEFNVHLCISQDDYDILADEDVEDYIRNDYELDVMCSWVMQDIATFIAKDYGTNEESEELVFDVDCYISDWEHNLKILADRKRSRRSKPLESKETKESQEETAKDSDDSDNLPF